MNILLKGLLYGLAALLLAAVCVIGVQHLKLDSLGGKLATAQATAITAQFDAQAASLNAVSVTNFVDRIVYVHDTTTNLQLKVSDYVPPIVDHDFPLPVGFVRLHDAAVDLSALPGAGATDAQASDVKASEAAGVIVGNYGTCHEIAEQLSGLQDWERQRELQDAAFQQQLTDDYQSLQAGSP
jgi:hypothetical protein